MCVEILWNLWKTLKSQKTSGGGQAAMGGYWDIYTILHILRRYAM